MFDKKDLFQSIPNSEKRGQTSPWESPLLDTHVLSSLQTHINTLAAADVHTSMKRLIHTEILHLLELTDYKALSIISGCKRKLFNLGPYPRVKLSVPPQYFRICMFPDLQCFTHILCQHLLADNDDSGC